MPTVAPLLVSELATPTTQELTALVEGTLEVTAAPLHDDVIVSTTAPSSPATVDTGVIRAVLAELEPRDQSTSFASEDTEVLPLLAAEPGRRRAATRRSARTNRLRLPSAPLVAGLATLAVTVGGVAWTSQHEAVTVASTTDSISALSGNTATVVGENRQVVSRSTDRVSSTDTDSSSTSSENDQDAAAVTKAAAKRNAALETIDDQASKRSKDLADAYVIPVDSYTLTARFGETSSLWSTVHTGLDFAAPTGTAIHAVAAGTVTFAGYDGSYGYKTVVTLEDGTELWYCHQSAQYVSVGDTVTAGETIGLVGATGNVTGPHLHLEVRPGGGDPVDPYAWLVNHGLNP
ncbi:M23 family metallopeptidase [Nocardioides sp. GY 10127]|nr:M23 family metallopeptidase [Nocardioides sp. GY 10127]